MKREPIEGLVQVIKRAIGTKEKTPSHAVGALLHLMRSADRQDNWAAFRRTNK